MTELIGLVASWQAFSAYGTTLLVFGFAPGFILRLIVKLYPKGDLRRAELVAELYAMPRIWRPMWVVQQIETGLFEGLSARRVARKSRRAPTSPAPIHVMRNIVMVKNQETIVSLLRLQTRNGGRLGDIALRTWTTGSGHCAIEVSKLPPEDRAEFRRVVQAGTAKGHASRRSRQVRR